MTTRCKHALAVTAALVIWLILMALMLAVPGCSLADSLRYGPPPATVLVDTDDDQTPDAVAVDADGDTVPDRDATGELIIDPVETQRLQTVLSRRAAADQTATSALTILGYAIGAPGLLTGLYGLAKKAKLGRALANTVESVQAGRRAVADQGAAIAGRIRAGDTEGALELAERNLTALTDALQRVQAISTQLQIEAQKQSLKLPSVSAEAAAP